jgi:hypothetical protein
MRQRAGNIGLPQAFVKKHAGGVAFDQIAHGLGKQGGPGLGFFIELVGGHGELTSKNGEMKDFLYYRALFPTFCLLFEDAITSRRLKISFRLGI